MGDSLSTQTFADATEGAETVLNEIEVVERAGLIFTAVSDMAICLVSMLGDRQFFDDRLRKTIPKKLYTSSLEIAPLYLKWHERVIPTDIMDDITPHRVVPLMLPIAFSLQHDCDETGLIPGTAIHVLDNCEDYPEKWRERRMDIAVDVRDTFSDFLTVGMGMIQEHMGYRRPIDPLLVSDIMGIADAYQINFRKKPLSSWFMFCMDEVVKASHPQTQKQEFVI